MLSKNLRTFLALNPTYQLLTPNTSSQQPMVVPPRWGARVGRCQSMKEEVERFVGWNERVEILVVLSYLSFCWYGMRELIKSKKSDDNTH